MANLPTAPSAAVRKALEAIAEKRLGFDTLTTRRVGDYDFREVAVWSVEAALTEAYALGVASAKKSKAKTNPGGASPLHVRTMGDSVVLSFADARGANAASKKLRAAGIPTSAPVRDRLMGCTDIYAGSPGQRSLIVDIVRS